MTVKEIGTEQQRSAKTTITKQPPIFFKLKVHWLRTRGRESVVWSDKTGPPHQTITGITSHSPLLLNVCPNLIKYRFWLPTYLHMYANVSTDARLFKPKINTPTELLCPKQPIITDLVVFILCFHLARYLICLSVFGQCDVNRCHLRLTHHLSSALLLHHLISSV